VPGLLICHGFPNLNQGGALSARSFPELAERIATEMGWMVLVFNFRGAGDSFRTNSALTRSQSRPRQPNIIENLEATSTTDGAYTEDQVRSLLQR
jgi:predicted alpha/beta-fold hydrolase